MRQDPGRQEIMRVTCFPDKLTVYVTVYSVCLSHVMCTVYHSHTHQASYRPQQVARTMRRPCLCSQNSNVCMGIRKTLATAVLGVHSHRVGGLGRVAGSRLCTHPDSREDSV